MRFANLNQKDTLKIYVVNDKSLSLYRAKNKYGFSNLPSEDFRSRSEEIQGSEELESSKRKTEDD